MQENISAAAVTKVLKEMKDLLSSPPEGIKVIMNEDNIGDVQAEIDGPVGTPFEGGLFRMKLVLGHEFPKAPPKGYFLTKIFHPNVSKTGEICVNTLKRDWSPDLGMRHIFMVVRCLLIEPFPESALNEEAGKLLLENYTEYAKHACLMTNIHAKKPMPLTTDSASNSAAGEEAGGAHASKTSKAAAMDKKVVQKKKSLKRL